MTHPTQKHMHQLFRRPCPHRPTRTRYGPAQTAIPGLHHTHSCLHDISHVACTCRRGRMTSGSNSRVFEECVFRLFTYVAAAAYQLLIQLSSPTYVVFSGSLCLCELQQSQQPCSHLLYLKMLSCRFSGWNLYRLPSTLSLQASKQGVPVES